MFGQHDSVARVDTEGNTDRFILPPVQYGGSSRYDGDYRILVYTDWGTGLVDDLAKFGLPTTLDHSSDPGVGIADSYVFISRRRQ